MTNQAKPTKVEAQRRKELNDLRHVLQSRQGRRFVWRVLSMGKPFCTTFTGNRSGDFNEGRRSIANDIIKDLFDIGSDKFAEMMVEAEKEAR